MAWVVPVVFVVAWQFASRGRVIDPKFFPAPLSLWDTFVDLVKAGQLQAAIWASMQRVLIGFAFGSVAGVAAGLILGMSRLLRAALNPFLAAMYVVPKLALLPILLLIFGTGNLPMIILIGMAVFFFMWISTMHGIMSVEDTYIEAAESFGVNRAQLFYHVLFPAALPDVFMGLRLSSGVSVLMVVGIEFVEGTKGLGVLIWNSWNLFQSKPMYVGMVTVAIVGALFMLVVDWIGRLVTPWASSSSGGPKGYF